MTAFFFVLNAAGWQYGIPLDKDDLRFLQATSACLATIVVMQMMNVFLCHHPVKSSLAFELFGNPLILLGLASELGLILFIIYTPAGNWLFGTAPIGGEVWGLALAAAVLLWAVDEVRKLWLRRGLAATA